MKKDVFDGTKSFDPKLVQQCRDIIAFGIKRAQTLYGVGFPRWSTLEKNTHNDAEYIRFLSNMVCSPNPRSGFQRMKNFRLLEYTPEACVIKFGDKLFDKITIAYAELHLPLTIIKKLRIDEGTISKVG